MLIHTVQELATWSASVTHWSDLLQTMHWQLPHDWMVLAQQFKDPDFTGDVSRAWNHFVKTGQVWAFLIGIVFGYMVKAFTSFG